MSFCGKEFETYISNVGIGNTKSCGCQKYLNQYHLVGQHFGRLTVIAKTRKRSKCGTIIWKCQCDCGNIIEVDTSSLTTGHTQSCGCLQKDRTVEVNSQDLINCRYGDLVCLKKVGTSDEGNLWLCQCDCGDKIVCSTKQLRNGKTHCGYKYIISKAEEQIAKIFDNIGIEYQRQKTFPDCVNPKTNHRLKFDFFLPKYNILLEYDGKQHFELEETSGWYCPNKLEDIQYRDSLKNAWAKKNGYKLVRISYLEEYQLSEGYLLDQLGI